MERIPEQMVWSFVAEHPPQLFHPLRTGTTTPYTTDTRGKQTMSERPFRVLGIQQIAVGGLDKNPLRKFWVDTLGLALSCLL